MKTKLFTIFSILLIILFGCILEDSNTSKFEIEGDWAFILEDGSYGEAYLFNDSITFLTEILGSTGPYFYQVKKDSLFYYDQKFEIKKITCGIFELCSKDYCFKLNRIYTNAGNEDYSNTDPFYLRRCNYLVQKGLITMEDAVKYLNSSEITEEIIEEEIPLKYPPPRSEE